MPCSAAARRSGSISRSGTTWRIPVITHIEELKNLFPAYIEVSRTPEGPQVTIR